MKLTNLTPISVYSFVTIWIFARMKRLMIVTISSNSFVTIWIFARMKLWDIVLADVRSFVTIWIFARMKRRNEQTNDARSFVTIWIFARMKLTSLSYLPCREVYSFLYLVTSACSFSFDPLSFFNVSIVMLPNKKGAV